MNFLLSLSLVCALAGSVAAQVQIGGMRIGPKPKQQPAAGGESSSGAQSGPAQPGSQAATEAWRQVQREHEDRLARLHDWATNPPKGPIGTDQRARSALFDWKNIAKLDDVKKGCAEGRYKGERAGTTLDAKYMTAQTMCPLIAEAEAHTKKALRAWTMAYGESLLDNLDKEIRDMEKDKQVPLKQAV